MSTRRVAVCYTNKVMPSQIIQLLVMGRILSSLFIVTSLLGWDAPKVWAQSQEPIQNLTLRGYVRPNGSLFVEETITFHSPVAGNDFHWNIAPHTTLPHISIDNSPPRGALVRSTNSTGQTVGIKSGQKGKIYRLTYSFNGAVHLVDKEATVRWQLVGQAHTTIEKVQATLSLPAPVDPRSISARLFATNNIRQNTVHVGDQVITAALNLVAPQATAALYARWPSSGFHLTFLVQFISQVSNATLASMFLSVIALPVVALIALLGMLVKQYWQERHSRNKEKRETPPSPLSAAVVGTLVHKRLAHKELLATIFDLAQRGYIDMVRRDNTFSFGRRKPIDASLALWEKSILEQLFVTNEFKIEHGKLEKQAKSRLVSAPIMNAYEAVYQTVTDKGYFVDNPHLVRVYYKLVGLAFYFLSLFSFVFLLATGKPFIMLLPITSVFLTAFVIIHLAHRMPRRTQQGMYELAEWLRFRNFLADKTPLPATRSDGNLFFAYLPYALVLGVEKKWIRRFRSQAILQPSWYIVFGEDSTESFTEQFISVLDETSKTFATLHGPIVE